VFATNARSYFHALFCLFIDVIKYSFGYVNNDPYAKAIKHLKQFAPINWVIALLNFAKKVFTYTDTARSIVLPEFLSFTTGPNNSADSGCTLYGYVHKNLTFVRIL
jgi:hypothetical protein